MSAPRPRPRVLLVDDDPAVLRATRRALAAVADVTTAEHGTAALAELHRDVRYDVVFTDYNMSPGPSGLWLLAWFREYRYATRRVLLSGDALPHLAAHLRSGLVERFIAKPADTETLQAALRDLCHL